MLQNDRNVNRRTGNLSNKFWLFWNTVRNTSIKNRIIASFLLLSVIPLYTTAIYAYNKSSQDIHNKISKYSVGLTDQLKTNIRLENQKFELLSDQIMMNQSVQANLANDDALDGYERRAVYLNINQMLSEQFNLLNHIKNIRIDTASGELFYDLGFDSFREQDIDRITGMFAEVKGNDIWTYGRTKRGVDCIILARQINSRSNWSHHLGYIFIAIEESFYSKNIYGELDMGGGSELFIIDRRGDVLSTRNRYMNIGKNDFSHPLLQEIEVTDSQDTFAIHLDDRDFLAAYAYDVISEWYLVSLVPYEYLNEETWEIRRNIIVVSAICLIFSLFMTFIISTSISAPLSKLVKLTRQVSRGNLDLTIRDHKNDEIGYLTNQFDNMLRQIRNLIAQIKANQKKEREIELQLLQAQINPHFLFNTLNSLKWTASLSQAESVSDGLGALAELLRNTIVDRKEVVTLREELKNIENYIIIQKVRYGDSFTVTYEVDEHILEGKILKFLLQPIVENAIIHGSDGGKRETTITITCVQEAQNLEITISDDGKGMTDQQIKQLLDPRNESEHRLSNIGIFNVNERIKLHFGEQYGLHFRSKVGSGTDVIMTIPLILEE